jgi:hypothetical protein
MISSNNSSRSVQLFLHPSGGAEEAEPEREREADRQVYRTGQDKRGQEKTREDKRGQDNRGQERKRQKRTRENKIGEAAACFTVPGRRGAGLRTWRGT